MDNVADLNSLDPDFVDGDYHGADDEFQNVELTTPIEDIQPIESTEPSVKENEPPLNNIQSGVIEELLKLQGIQDPTALKFAEENGEESTTSFYDLSLEEQLEILSYKEETPQLGEDEENFINFARSNNLSVDEVIQHIREQAIQEYVNSVPVDLDLENLSNEEIYLLNLTSQVGELSEEELDAALEIERQNPELFEKKVESIRNTMIEQDKIKKEEEQHLAEVAKQEEAEEFKNLLINSAPNIKNIGRLELDEGDIEDAIQFLLEEDGAGNRYIAKALNDPEALLKMSWFYLKGEEAFNFMANYYEQQIKEHSQSNYQKGLADAKKGTTAPKEGKVVVKPEDNKQRSYYPNQKVTPISLDHLD